MRSPAKVNLFIEVHGRREDGYHDIETVFQTIDLCDGISLRLTDSEMDFACTVGELETESNLCLRAANLLRAATGENRGVAIHLDKRIPWAAGFGGGSSNAATTLLGLRELWQLDVNDAELHNLDRQLGADVPFFLRQGCALGRGIGDELTPIDARGEWEILIVKPPVSIRTAEVYAALDCEVMQRDGPRTSSALISGLADGIFREICAGAYNRFESVVMPLQPVVARVKRILQDSGAGVAMLSGTGSGVFALYEQPSAAHEAACRLDRNGDLQVFLTRTIRGIVMT